MDTKNSIFYQRRHSVPKKILASLVILSFVFSQAVPAGYADITLRPDERVVPYTPETEATEDSSNSQTPSANAANNAQTTSSFLGGSSPLSTGATTTTTSTVTQTVEPDAVGRAVAKRGPAGGDTQTETLQAMYRSLQREYVACLEEKNNRNMSNAKKCEEYLGQLKNISSAMSNANYDGAGGKKPKTETGQTSTLNLADLQQALLQNAATGANEDQVTLSQAQQALLQNALLSTSNGITPLDQAMLDQIQQEQEAALSNIDQSVGFEMTYTTGIQYEQEEYAFEDAVDQLVPDYASAVVVESLSAQDLRDLVNLDVEVGIAVIRGKIVLFTSGSNQEIKVNPVANSLLSESAIIVHTHPQGTTTLPSASDFALAGDTVEYLINEDGVYAYNRDGLVSEQPLTEEDLIQLVEAAHVPDASSQEARAVLNQFIADIDEYNERKDNAVLFRSADTLLPGRPALMVWNSSSPAAPLPTIAQDSTSHFSVGYNVTNAGSYAGATINFANTPGGSQNLSGLDAIVFHMKMSAACTGNCVKIEIKDTDGYIAAFYVKGLSTDYKQVSISKDTILYYFPDLKLGEIKEINFVFENTRLANKIGTLDVQSGGLYFEPPLSSGSGPRTNFGDYGLYPTPSEMEPCLVATAPCPAGQNRDTVTTFVNTPSQIGFFYNLGNGSADENTTWGGTYVNFGTGSFDLTQHDLVLAVNATGTTKLKVELISGTPPDEKKVTVILEGVAATDQFYRITSDITDLAGYADFDP
ncbi:MAG TPA: hypothetical protein P5561_02520, partial [Candidatus Omnitrophota bacterium]|nr:hypothetical protein [Candidatus Omnitrophota bacterium]